jgi:putative ABC transport system permease protein
MTWLRWLRDLWRTLTRSRRLDRDLNQELRTYVDLLSDEAAARGDELRDARRRALASFGGIAAAEEQVRSRRTGAWLAQALRDARYGARGLRRAPAFAVGVVLTLGLAVGATGAMFTAVRAVVLAPLPYPDPDRLVHLVGQSYVGEYLQYRARGRTLDVAGYAALPPVTLTGRGEPTRIETVAVTSDLFDVLGVTPALGRGWREADAAPGAEPVVTLSDRVWRERFGADTGVVGRTVILDGVPHRVRGVMAADFAFPDATTGVWIPLIIDPADRIALWSRGGAMIGRLRTGEALDDARAEVRALAPTFAELFPWRMPPDYGEDASVIPLRDERVGDVGAPLTAALGAVAFVLIIACLNVGVLMMGRSMARRREMATRSALGASGGRLARQVFVECVVLASLGGLAALGLGAFAVASLAAWLPADLPRLHEVRPDRWLLASVAALTALAGVVVALVPTWRAARPSDGPTGGTPRAGQDRAARAATRALVALEVALAVTLLVGAGLLLRSLDRLLHVSPGFTAGRLISATVSPPLHRYAAAPARRAFFDDLLARVEAMPQVDAAAVTDRLPFASPPWGSVFTIEGRPDPATESGEWPWADYRSVVSAGFFRTMGIPVTDGRGFTPADNATAGRVAMVSDALARQYWPGEDPVGRRIRFPGTAAGEWITIVGTTGDVKWERLSETPLTALYLPLGQDSVEAMSVVVRTGGDADAGTIGGALRDAVRGLDAETPVDRIVAVERLVNASARTSRFLAVLFAGFALVGVLLGGVGIYGVTADSVARRGHEIAVRLAVGAESASILRLVVRQGVTVALVGLGIGVIASVAGSRLIASLLFGVTATDPVTFALVPIPLLAAVALACALPARRATKISPLAVLRDS